MIISSWTSSGFNSLFFPFFFSSLSPILSGPALQLLSQGMERQLHPVSPPASLHPSHGARSHLPSRQPHPLCPSSSPSPSRPALLPSFRPRRPPAAISTTRAATCLQPGASGHQHGHQPGHRPSPAALTHAACPGHLQSPVYTALVRNVPRLHRLPAQPHQTSTVPLHLIHTHAHTHARASPRGPYCPDTLVSKNRGV